MRSRLTACACAALLAAGALAADKPVSGDVTKGEAVFAQQCATCHNAASAERKIGPGLKGLFKRTRLPSGKPATEQTIRARIDDGGNGMPAYRDLLSEPEGSALIAYLRTL
jgi:mono/diheme cytochrome c family protein